MPPEAAKVRPVERGEEEPYQAMARHHYLGRSEESLATMMRNLGFSTRLVSTTFA